MKRVITAIAIALALVIPAGAFAQCPTGAELYPGITAQVYGNIVEVVAPNASGCYVVVRVKNAAGDVLAEQDGWLPSVPDWNNGYLAFFLTDWSEKAEYFGIQPGDQLEVLTEADLVVNQAVGIPPGFGPATHTVAEIKLTKVAPNEDAVAGAVKPPMGSDIRASFLGLDMNTMIPAVGGGASPICLGMKIPLNADGSFAADFSGECNLLRNGAMMFEYTKKNFRIYRFEHIPGVAAIINTPFSLFAGQMYTPYRAHLNNGSGKQKAWSLSRPLPWLNLGLFSFSYKQSAVPIRRGDRLHLSQVGFDDVEIEGVRFTEKVPNFGFSLASPPIAPPITRGIVDGIEQFAYLTVPEGRTACVTCIGCHQMGPDYVNTQCFFPKPPKDETAVGAAGPVRIDLGPAPDAMIGFMQRPNGNFYVAHKGLQKPLSYLLSENPVIPSMYGFTRWLFCDMLDVGMCPDGALTESPRLARAELMGFIKK